jgi:glycosyltransferase involved in cell wall biosynthesis
MKKVLCLIPSMVGGGAEKVMSILVNQLQERSDLDVTLVTMENLPDEHAISLDVKRHTLSNLREHDPAYQKAIAFPFQLFQFIRFVKKNSPYIIIAFLERAVILTLISSYFIRARLIISERNGITQNLSTRGFFARTVLEFVYRHLYKRAHKIVVVSRTIQNDLIHDYQVPSEKIELIYNPYEIEKIDHLKTLRLPEPHRAFFDSGRVLINVGRYYPVKNQGALIEVFAALRESFPDLKLCLIGKGPLENEILAALEKHQVKEHTLLPGFQKNPYAYLSCSSIYVMTSLFEGFPNAMVEAMLCGLPVVAYDCKSGPQEILEDRFGKIVPLNDKNSLKAAIFTLLTNSTQYNYYKNAGSERARRFSVNSFITRFLKMINDNKELIQH